MKRIQLSAAVMFAVTSLPAIVAAQGTPTATLTGVVRDSRRQPIINAKVLIVDARTGTVTSRTGEYTIVTAPGTVSIQVTARGFKSYQVNGLQLVSDISNPVDFVLADSLPRGVVIAGVMTEGFTVDQVDDPVTYLSGPTPAYPPDLKAAGISGRVTLRFIVGTDGLAESNSIAVISSTNTKFEDPAIDAIVKSKFRSAIIKGTPVRQIVEQVVRFVPTTKTN